MESRSKLRDPNHKVSVTIRAQKNGRFCFGFANPVKVSCREAERFGFAGSKSGVSVLDVLVKAHRIIYGEAFTAETASDYLSINPAGYASTLFGEKGTANGFLLNEGCPHDGTKASGGGYNGTTMAEQLVRNGDVLDFFTYQDAVAYTDIFSWIQISFGDLTAGGQAEIMVTGVKAMDSYRYRTAEEMRMAAEPVEDVGFAWLNPITGGITKIRGVKTDLSGRAALTLPDSAGEYWLAAISDTSDPGAETWVIGNPTKLNVKQ